MLYATNTVLNSFNFQKMKELHQPVADIPAMHNCSATLEALGGFEPHLILSIGSKVLLCFNL